jgi:four helix bundle protein
MEGIMKAKNVFVTKSFDFALAVVKTCQKLTKNKMEYILTKQLIRSGTAIGALIREAQNAESKADFIHKLAIAQKECGETLYWRQLIKEADYLNETEYLELSSKATELLKMLRSSTLTTNKKLITHNS